MLDKPNEKFVIQMGNGLFYERMVGLAEVVTTGDRTKAFRFDSRRAAIQVCATTHRFAGSYIVPYDASPAQPGGAVSDPWPQGVGMGSFKWRRKHGS
jgi:hypothetical protein